jgi:hypothetical protein
LRSDSVVAPAKVVVSFIGKFFIFCLKKNWIDAITGTVIRNIGQVASEC